MPCSGARRLPERESLAECVLVKGVAQTSNALSPALLPLMAGESDSIGPLPPGPPTGLTFCRELWVSRLIWLNSTRTVFLQQTYNSGVGVPGEPSTAAPPVHGRPAPSETAPTRAPREALSTRGSGRTERTRTVGKGEGQSAGQKGTRSGRAGKRGRGRAGRGGTHLSSRFCPTHTRPPWRGVGLLQARCRTWKPMPQVVLQGDQVVQGVQPPFLRRQSGGGAESQGEETVPCGHPPAPPSAPRPRGPPAWGPRD